MSVVAVLALSPLGCGKSQPAADASAAPAPVEEVAAPAPVQVATAPAEDAKAPAPEATPDCVPQDVMAVLGSIDPDFAKLDAGAVSLCGSSEDSRYCVALELASGKRTSVKLDANDGAHLPQYPAGFDDGLVKDDTRPVLKLCPAAETRCKDLHVGQVFAAHFSADKARIVVTSLDEGKLNAHIYDAATQAETSVVPIGASDLPNCTFAAFAGDALIVATGACTGGGKAWLVDGKTGTKIADIGKSESAFVLDGQFAQVEGNTFVFRDASGKVAYVQDVASGEVQATVDLEKATDGTKPKDDAAFVFATPSELVFVEARPLVDTVIVASRKDGSVLKVHVPRPCP